MLELRPFQREALRALESRGQVICVSPTGSGKSLIYERFASRPGMRTLLVTPLVALARQQATRLKEAGVRVLLGAGGGTGDSPSPNPGPETGAWIISPEMLSFPSRKKALRDWRPEFLVVDECHCLWEWGDDFRPAFARLPALLGEKDWPIERSLWLTATLPHEARVSLRAALPGAVTEIGAFGLPPGLGLKVLRVPWVHRSEALAGWVRARAEPGIVFASTRETTERLARFLSATGRRVQAYHAGLSREERRAIESRLRSGDIEVVIATSAFGMGMDYPNLRWVVLWQAPPSLLALAQAIGRVGRSGAAGHAAVFWDLEDFRLMEWTLKGSAKRKRELLGTLQFLRSFRCRRSGLESYFEGRAGLGCEAAGGLCDFCAAGSRLPSAGSGAQIPRTAAPVESVLKQVRKFLVTGTRGR